MAQQFEAAGARTTYEYQERQTEEDRREPAGGADETRSKAEESVRAVSQWCQRR